MEKLICLVLCTVFLSRLEAQRPESTVPPRMAKLFERHNSYRAELGLPPLKWSNSLATFAQEWADTVVDKGCDLKHRPNNPHGENLYWTSGVARSEDAAESWETEKAQFVYEPFTGERGDGHYTQMIWENTTEVGCAMAKCRKGEIWVCNYSPPGNYLGQFPYRKKCDTEINGD